MRHLATLGLRGVATDAHAVLFLLPDGTVLDNLSGEELDAEGVTSYLEQAQAYVKNLKEVLNKVSAKGQFSDPNKLVEHLNSEAIFPEVNEGTVTLKTWQDKENYDDERNLTDEELAVLGFVKGYVDAHPEGSDRGGFLPYARFSVDGDKSVDFYYDEHGGVWV